VTSKLKFRPLTVGCLLAATVIVVIGIVYFTKSASALPSFFPGHQAGSTHHHIKHGIAMIGLACLAVIGAWFSTAPGSPSDSRKSASSRPG
jgi:hypothetical protein